MGLIPNRDSGWKFKISSLNLKPVHLFIHLSPLRNGEALLFISAAHSSFKNYFFRPLLHSFAKWDFLSMNSTNKVVDCYTVPMLWQFGSTSFIFTINSKSFLRVSGGSTSFCTQSKIILQLWGYCVQFLTNVVLLGANVLLLYKTVVDFKYLPVRSYIHTQRTKLAISYHMCCECYFYTRGVGPTV